MNRPRTWALQTGAALLLPLMVGCVKKSDYDALQMENQDLQTRVDQASHELTQSQTDVTLLQGRLQKLASVESDLEETRQALQQSRQETDSLQQRLHKTRDAQPELLAARQALKTSQEECQSLKGRFDHFLAGRRSAMVGRKYPVLNLENGTVLRQAEIAAFSSDEISIRHAGGVASMPLAASPLELRWDACYDLQDGKDLKLEATPAKPSATQVRLAVEHQDSSPPASPSTLPVAAGAGRPPAHASTADLLRARLAAQRAALNTDYQALALKNGAALRGVPWDSSQPEASPLLNSLSGSRAVLGLSRLQSQRTAILSTLRQLRELDPSAR